VTSNLAFRWLGVQGIELRCGEQTLAIDPFFTRPRLMDLLLRRRVRPNLELAQRLLPACNYILVTHSHYDHLMDVPGLALQTGASVFGSPNTGRILEQCGMPSSQFHLASPGDRFNLGPFEVEALATRHVHLPLVEPIFNGPVALGLRPPLRLIDYRMDYSLGFAFRVEGLRILVCPGPARRPTDVLFAGVDWKPAWYRSMLAECQPHLFVPLHWDNFFRPLDQPLRELARPTGSNLNRLRRLAAEASPSPQFLIPTVLQWVDLTKFQQDLTSSTPSPSHI
jgi:L-ascorbate metabolism protein UlaG (beta-lactamase superfamily)